MILGWKHFVERLEFARSCSCLLRNLAILAVHEAPTASQRRSARSFPGSIQPDSQSTPSAGGARGQNRLAALRWGARRLRFISFGIEELQSHFRALEPRSARKSGSKLKVALIKSGDCIMAQVRNAAPSVVAAALIAGVIGYLVGSGQPLQPHFAEDLKA